MLSEIDVAEVIKDETSIVCVVVTGSSEEVEAVTGAVVVEEVRRMTDAVIVVEAVVASGDTVGGLGSFFDFPGPATVGPGGSASTSSDRVRNPRAVV
jgi:hypothetical protein